MKEKALTVGLLCLLLVVNFAIAGDDVPELLTSSSIAKAGIIVYIGSADADAMIKSRDAGSFIVQSALFDDEKVNAARKQLLAKKAYGVVAVIKASSKRLPYTDNLVNIVVINNPAAITASGIPLADIGRIVTPHGVVLISGDEELAQAIAAAMGSTEVSKVGDSTKIIKPRPKEMDEWTHARHDAQSSCVSQDTLVGLSKSLQFHSGKQWLPRNFNSRTADGKNYYYTHNVPGVYNELICRDSFNGILLWKKVVFTPKIKPVRKTKLFGGEIPMIVDHNTSFTALGDRVYIFLEAPKHLVALDSNTGKVVQEYKEITNAGYGSLIHVDENMIFSNNSFTASVNRKTGKLNWKKTTFHGTGMVLSEGNYGAVIMEGKSSKNNKGIICFNLSDGKEIWRNADLSGIHLMKYGIILSKPSQGRKDKKPLFITATSVKDGKELWKKRTAPEVGDEMFAFNKMVWDNTTSMGYDPLTGAVKYKVPGGGKTVLRCSRDYPATVNYLYQDRPLYLRDIKTGERHYQQSFRAACGSSPAFLIGNGMIYGFPKECYCWDMLRGYSGFATYAPLPIIPEEERLLKGPAYGSITKKEVVDADSKGWPTFLGNEARHCSTLGEIKTSISKAWEKQIADQTIPAWSKTEWSHHTKNIFGLISSATANKELVFVSATNSHRMIALDATTGEKSWTFMTESRIFIPPTLYDGMAIFAGEDGYVYCLRASDGQLIWRYQGIPNQRRVAIHGQIESHSPISNGVLVVKGHVYFMPGRKPDMEHRFVAYKLDAYTGELVTKTEPMTTFHEEYTPIIAVPSYGETGKYEGEKGEKQSSRNVFSFAANSSVHDETTFKPLLGSHASTKKKRSSKRTIYHVGTKANIITTGLKLKSKTLPEVIAQNELYIASLTEKSALSIASTTETETRINKYHGAKIPYQAPKVLWTKSMKNGRAIVLTPKFTVVTMTTGASSGQLIIFDSKTGKEVAKQSIAGAPTYYGLAIANGKIYVSTEDGKLTCFK